ncbi:MAG TPA: hypothetical protein VIH95_12160 [Acidimicrobiales bacterium]
MPRASRRRRRPRRRGLGQSVLIAIAAAITVVLVAGTLIAIHTQSKGYRSAATAGYVALADRVGQASMAAGARLSSLMAGAPSLTNSAFPDTARGNLQQGLDMAVVDTGLQAHQAQNLASPPPQGGLSSQFTQVMELRASATVALRTTIDQLLGMQPLPIAGAPSSTTPAAPATLISADQAATEMTAEGRSFEESDAGFRALRLATVAQHLRLQPSVWVPTPVATASLGSASLGATAAGLASSSALQAFHHLVVTAVGLVPPAIPTGGVGTESTSCIAPTSTVPGSSPAVVPPTATLAALVSVTNCGTVPEAGVKVSVTVSVADPPGMAPPPAGRRGGQVQSVVSLDSGASAAPDLGPLPVAAGHRYTVTVTVSLPPGQADPAGSMQQFLVVIAS